MEGGGGRYHSSSARRKCKVQSFKRAVACTLDTPVNRSPRNAMITSGDNSVFSYLYVD